MTLTTYCDKCKGEVEFKVVQVQKEGINKGKWFKSCLFSNHFIGWHDAPLTLPDVVHPQTGNKRPRLVATTEGPRPVSSFGTLTTSSVSPFPVVSDDCKNVCASLDRLANAMTVNNQSLFNLQAQLSGLSKRLMYLEMQMDKVWSALKLEPMPKSEDGEGDISDYANS